MFCPNSAWTLEAAPCERPTSSIQFQGTRESTGAYRDTVTVTLSAQSPQSHTEGAAVGLRYKLNGAAHYEVYGGPLTFSEEGQYTLSYYAVDSKGNTEATANVTTFSIRPTAAPDAASLVGPSLTMRALTPAYTWNRVVGATDYVLWVNRDDTTVLRQTYHWSAVCSPASSVCSVTPAHNVWNGVQGATEYVLWVENAGTEAVVLNTVVPAACSSSTCSATPATALPGGAYRFWIRGRNASGVGAWSQAVEFTR
jgi:hypothetical protein